MADSDNDISWLTQESNVDVKPSFDVGGDYFEEYFFGGSELVSTEDQPSTSKSKVLYDGVIAEDISSNECIDNM